MTTILKIVFASDDWQVESGADVEEPLDEALLAAGVGEIVSGGVGAEGIFYNVEVEDAASALPVIQRILRHMGVPESTRIEGFGS